MSLKPKTGFTLLGAVLVATVGNSLFGEAQKPSASGTMPVFQVDSSWPRLPNNWVVGVVSAVNVDSHDNVWILHRPRSVQEGMKDRAAPPVLEFNAASSARTSSVSDRPVTTNTGVFFNVSAARNR